eukprot:936675-Pelagomonas_calceolata.AAC.5
MPGTTTNPSYRRTCLANHGIDCSPFPLRSCSRTYNSASWNGNQVDHAVSNWTDPGPRPNVYTQTNTLMDFVPTVAATGPGWKGQISCLQLSNKALCPAL